MNEKLLDQIIDDTLSLNKINDSTKKQKFIKKYLESLDVVNDTGEIIGCAPRGLIHRTGLRHRTVFIIIIAPNGKILLQTRGHDVGSSLRLDISVGGHVKSGETEYVESSIREMKEELGFLPDKSRLVFVKEYNRNSPISITRPLERNRERRILYEYRLSEEEYESILTSFKERESKSEVLDFNWFTISEVIHAMNSENVADGLGSNFVEWLDFKK